MSTAVDPTWRQCLYLSHLADGCRYDVFTRLAQCSRRHNAEHGIGGCLLFDGQRFCQLIEGPPAAVAALWLHIQRDRRHRDIRLLFDRLLPLPAGPAGWAYGYCGADDLDGFDNPALRHGPGALAAFEAIRASADLAR